MDKQRARQLYELADRLSKLDVNTLSEEQLQQRSTMIAKLQEEVKTIKEFAPGAGGGESGRWYTDDQMTDLVGDGWWNDLDISGEVSKQQMIQEAQAWLDDQGYSVHVLNCKVNDDDMEWFIEGSFQNSNFAKKGVAEDMSRRGFLRGLGAAALGAAGVNAVAGPNDQEFINKVQRQHFDMVEKNPRYAKEHADLKIALVRGMSGASAEMNKQWAQKTSQLLQKYGVKVNEDFNGEYDDEAGMAESNLHTMARAVNGLLDTIEDNDNLPEWAQEKLAKAEMMVTSVWDYLLSQKEQGVDPKVESIVELYQIDEAVLNEIDPGLITNLVAVFPTISKIIVSNALTKAASEKQETSQMIDVLKKKANGEEVTPEESEAMKTQFKDLIGYGLTAVGASLTGGALAGIASVYKKEIFELIKSKGPEVLINLLKSKGNMDVVKILSSKFLGKHALPFYTAPKVQESKKPSPKLTPVEMKKTDPVSEEINTEAYERLQKVFAFKNYES